MVDLRKANPNRVFSPPIGQRSAVAASREIEIDGDPAVVWELLISFDRWPEWNPDITAVSTSGPPSVGATFRWGHESMLITSTIQLFESPRRIAWTSRSLGTTVLNDWHVQPRHDGTVVWEDESVHGPLARLLRRPLQRSLHRWVGNGLQHLKTEAERRTVLGTGA